jgi:rod shape-determining protein MreC
MSSLFRYLLKHHAFVLFILLETLALVMVFNYNSFQKASYLNSASRLSGNVYYSFNSVVGYFGLTRANRELAEENARLRMLLENQPVRPDSLRYLSSGSDTIIRYYPAKIINNSVSRPFNYITLDRGSKHGIKPDQGIISAGGIVGIVAQVSDSYAMGLSVLNRRWSVSAKVKKSGAYGALTWPGTNYRIARLSEIPLHVDIEIGDTIVTSGYSSVFPEGIMVGTIDGFTRPGGENYYLIDVLLSVDFKTVSHVEVVEIRNKEELKALEYLPERQ